MWTGVKLHIQAVQKKFLNISNIKVSSGRTGEKCALKAKEEDNTCTSLESFKCKRGFENTHFLKSNA